MTDHTVTIDEINIAFERWKTNLWDREQTGSIWRDWVAFLGDGYHERRKVGSAYIITEQVYSKIKLLNSSHYKTLLKVMEARK